MAARSRKKRKPQLPPPPRLEGAERDGVLALASLIGQLAGHHFATQSHERAAAELLEGFGDFMQEAGVVKGEELAKFMEGKGRRKAQLDAERKEIIEHAAALMSQRMAHLLLDILGRSGGVALAAPAARRGRTLLRRMEKNEELYTDEETDRIFDAYEGEIFTDVSQLMDALAKVQPGPASDLPKARRGAMLATGFFIACLASTWTLFLGDREVSGMLLGRFYRALCDEGLTTEQQLKKLWDVAEQERLREVHGAAFKAYGEIARRMGDYMGRVYIELVDASGGMLLTPRAARRAETMLKRVLSREDVITKEESNLLAAEFKKDLPKGVKELEAALDRILQAGAH